MFVSAGLAAVFLFPFENRTEAAKPKREQAQNRRQRLPNYDIRSDKTAIDKIAGFRATLHKNAAHVADVRDSLVRGERALRKQVPTLAVEYNRDSNTPEVIAPDPKKGKAFLSRGTRSKRSAALKEFLAQNAELVGTEVSHVASLKLEAEYTNPDGELSFVELKQEANGIPIFRGEVKAGFTKDGELVRVVNNLAPGLDEFALSADFGDPASAVVRAALSISVDPSDLRMGRPGKGSNHLKTVFGDDDSSPSAEKMYFPTEPGVAIPAWRVLIWEPSDAYYVIVDAVSGEVLWRKNITEDQTQASTFGVYANPGAMINVAHSPFPFSPGPLSPNGAQGAAIQRSLVTRVGNEGLYVFNQQGWIGDGGTKTDGNAVQAGLDRDGVDGIDTNSEATSANRSFDFAYSPFNPNTNAGETPVAAPQTYPGNDYQQGMVTQLFYITNWFHDETYRLGFTEAAGNFQQTNFTSQGRGGDRIRAEGQDSGGVNNANFSTPADGGRGRMQMYVWDRTSPAIDGSLDADVVVHELTHGLSNRLHGNSSGLMNDMSRGMGEGWSDFFSMALLSTPNDPIDGLYTTGAYVTYNPIGTSNNAYYGIRRFPMAPLHVVGLNGKPHNPLTFADIDTTQIDISDGAFAPRSNGTADEVHRVGEVWSAMLWEIRTRMVARLGWEIGNRRVLQLVTDAMKLAPVSPTFINERDALVAAAFAAGDPADVADVWAGFSVRGLGPGATIQNVGGTSISGGSGQMRVTQAFDTPNINQTPDISITEAAGDNDGFFEPGETLSISVPLKNSTGRTASGVTLNLAGGGTADYGTMAGISTITRQVSYTVPATAPCGSVIALNLDVNSSLGPASFTRNLAVGGPSVTSSENFDSVTAPAIPTGWTIESSYAPMTFVSRGSDSDTGPNSMFAPDLPNCTGSQCPNTAGGSTTLTSPPIAVTVAAAIVSFRHKFNTEALWDGGVLEISIDEGAFQDIIAAGGTFLSNGYNASMGVSAPNPLGGRAGWTGNSSGYITTVARMPAAAAGRNVRLRWHFGTDSNSAPAGGGWSVDSIQFAGEFACSVPVSSVSISGKVLTPDGRGLRNAVVSLIDAQGVSRGVSTSTFGFYQFDNVKVGQSYIIAVSSKRYRFASRLQSVDAALTDVDFTAQE
ncbi:MAG: M36 family metallopeptidase [Pyrinomonadaceae bacterium]